MYNSIEIETVADDNNECREFVFYSYLANTLTHLNKVHSFIHSFI